MKHPHVPGRWRRAAAVSLALVLTSSVGVVATPGVASAASFASFSLGVLEPDEIRHVWWNNATSDAYAPGLEVTEADDPNDVCHVTIARTWYVRHASGEREFHLEIHGGHGERCQVTVWLARLTKFTEVASGSLTPGQWRNFTLNDARTGANVYVVAPVPDQLASGDCAIEVVNVRYRTQPSGENEFAWRALNVGAATCSAQLRLVRLPVTFSHLANPMPPGSSLGVLRGIPDGIRVVVPGGMPAVNSAAACQYTVQPIGYWPRRSDTSSLNSGSVTCELTTTFADV
ncbi:hypothetical protein F4553_000476 [Allocatelliglobosispora scoriae]|uniref:Uncharacterized protein n=1 Tax=Allocatelliglobosispora scoriae TaxID=643052 RepID=A0A841BDB5_9ACTN|nr:hypothetical protein [Allocatelliglobosispora scoriae]MBB5867097.1 hypothetical protein [Allocatelliglobosispora scoriae]